jgi:hypothetical protein
MVAAFLLSVLLVTSGIGLFILVDFEFRSRISVNWSGRRGSNSQLSAWEFYFPLLYFQYLQNPSEEINVHATHTVHAMPDLRIAAGRFAGRFFIASSINLRSF